MATSADYELFLIRSKDDDSEFSNEYQKELLEFSKGAHASSQRAFAMDSMFGGGGPIGEFIFNNADALIAALTTVACVWIKARNGRKLRIKFGEVKIEAHTTEEIQEMVKHVKSLQDKKP